MNNSIFADGAGYVRGRFVPIAEATLPVTDWGFTRSDVVYDVVHVFKGGFFRLATISTVSSARWRSGGSGHRKTVPRSRRSCIAAWR